MRSLIQPAIQSVFQPFNTAPTGCGWLKLALLSVSFGFGSHSNVLAQDQGSIDDELSTLSEISEDSDYGFRNGSIVVAPIPFSNPTIGSGLMLGVVYLFKTDTTSKPSMIGAGALRSDNGSNGYGLSVKLAFDNNRWLFNSMFAKADVRYDLFTPIGNLPIRQDGVLARMSLAYGVTPELSFGGSLRYIDTAITPDAPGLPAIPRPFNQFLNVEVASIGVLADWDRRDDTIYPTSGGYLQFEASRNIALSGFLQDYNKGFANYTHYTKLGDSGVLVARASACAASSDTPFFDQCSLGATDGFRGFSVTQFLDLRSASFQVEYRQQFNKRLGMVAFGGVGMVGPNYQDLDIGGTHSAVGLGARYRVSKKFPLDFSVDLARNSLDENQLYIYVGQRF
jgi:outer membrane protein assembly factor BamA